MTYVTLRSNFSDSAEYRLLAMEADWVRRLKTEITAGDGGKTVLAMKGGSQLVLCDDDHTYRVRRVEYSNSLLLAEERPMCGGDDEALGPTFKGVATGAAGGQKYVVFGSLERLFEAKRASAHHDAVRLLQERPITIAELEGDEGGQMCEDTRGGTALRDGRNSQHYTFPQLVAMSHCSARELADSLAEAGAVVHHGYVRLLHPLLLREALQAVVFFLEGCAEVSWDAVEDHLCPSVYPVIVVRVVRAVYGAKDPAECAAGAAALLNVRKVMRALAAAAVAVVARDGDGESAAGDTTSSFPAVEFDRFYEVWTDSIPASFFASGEIPQRSEKAALLSLLHGVLIVRGVRGENYAGALAVWAPHDELPTDLSKRVAQLFELNPGRWAADALRAYMEPLLDPGVTFDHVVHRHAKEFRAPNQAVTYGRLA